jgi:microcystin-dependent protein
MSEPFLSEIKIVGFTFAPRGWAQCDGQILPINQYQSLYSLLGTNYGGDGRVTFGLPDLRGRAAVHFGANGVSLGSRSGTEIHHLALHELGPHRHRLRAVTNDADEEEPAGAFLSRSENNLYNSTGSTIGMGNTAVSGGGNQWHENMQPYLVMNFVIALTGLFPSRN